LARSAPLLAERASLIYDATAERWMVGPSGTKPDAGAAADLRHRTAKDAILSATTLANRPAAGPSAAGHFRRELAEFLTVALGLTVFGVIAGVLMVLA
jgi:hypothetical protein